MVARLRPLRRAAKTPSDHLLGEPGQAPEAIFRIDADQVTAREYCNMHGLWKA